LRRRLTTSLLVATLVLCGFVAAGQAAPIVASDYLGQGSEHGFNRATGWFFTPETDILVTALGVYDLDEPGLADRHEVGIFLTDGTPMVTAFVPAGTAAAFVPGTVAGTRFTSVAPTVLSADTAYYIQANNWGTDNYAYGAGRATYASGITWDGFGSSDSNSIYDNVVNYAGFPGNLGPNFAFQEVPEPGTLVLLGLGLGGLVVVRRRRNK